MERRFWLQKAPRESTEHDGQAVHVWVHGAARTTAGIMKSKGNYRYIIYPGVPQASRPNYLRLDLRRKGHRYRK